MSMSDEKAKERLYDTMGEMLYVVAMADGVIQSSERALLDDLLEGHPWADIIKWSFDYEQAREADIEEVYGKVIDFCHHHGPAREYAEFIDAMRLISKAAKGGDELEGERVASFSEDLIERFQKDLDTEEEE